MRARDGGRRTASIRRLATVSLGALVVSACAAERPSATIDVTRDTLPDGTVLVRYPALPIGEIHVAAEDLRIGSVDEDPNAAFGDVRGIDAASDGTIYVLDHLSSEVRAFGPDGRYLRTVATPGEGPGEINAANGLVMAGDSLLWIQDHGKWAMIGVTPEGDEVTRFPMPVRSYGYMWNGTIDDAGRAWKPAHHSDELQTFPPELGFHDGASRRYMKSYDPGSEAIDSVYVGDAPYRQHVARTEGGGYAHRQIPFDPELITVVDPAGGFWQVRTDAYRIVRLDERGDTVLVVESDLAREPVTGADRAVLFEAIDEQAGSDPGARAAMEEIVSVMPETKPIMDGLVVDDRGWLWVRRIVAPDETPLHDIFDRDGNYLGSVRLGFSAFPYFPLRVRNGHIYAIVQDALEISYVVRAPVPAPLGVVMPTESAGN